MDKANVLLEMLKAHLNNLQSLNRRIVNGLRVDGMIDDVKNDIFELEMSLEEDEEE